MVGLALGEAFSTDFALFYPPNRVFILDRFLAHFSLDLAGAGWKKARAADAMNPLRALPIIRTNFRSRAALIVPISTCLIWRFTEGVYYEIVSDAGFSEPYGDPVLAFTGEVARRGTDRHVLLDMFCFLTEVLRTEFRAEVDLFPDTLEELTAGLL